ncbi:MAG: hypothetical protein WBB57_01810, partial [Mycobacterium sp.]
HQPCLPRADPAGVNSCWGQRIWPSIVTVDDDQGFGRHHAHGPPAVAGVLTGELDSHVHADDADEHRRL